MAEVNESKRALIGNALAGAGGHGAQRRPAIASG